MPGTHLMVPYYLLTLVAFVVGHIAIGCLYPNNRGRTIRLPRVKTASAIGLLAFGLFLGGAFCGLEASSQFQAITGAHNPLIDGWIIVMIMMVISLISRSTRLAEQYEDEAGYRSTYRRHP